jgi:hypothetical protein
VKIFKAPGLKGDLMFHVPILIHCCSFFVFQFVFQDDYPEAYLKDSQQVDFLRGWVVSPLLNPQPGGPDYPNQLRLGKGYCRVLTKVFCALGMSLSRRHHFIYFKLSKNA